MQHLSSNSSFTPAWHHVPSPLATGRSNVSLSPYILPHQDSPRGAKRSRSKSSAREDMDLDSRRLRPVLPQLQTSTCSSGLPTPPLSASSSMSSAGSSIASFSSFPRSFSMQNWQPSSAGLGQGFYASPSEINSGKGQRFSRPLGPEELQNYANQGFATPAIRCEGIDFSNRQQKTDSQVRDSRSHSYSGLSSSCLPTSTSIPSFGGFSSSAPTPPPAPTLDAQHLQITSPDDQPWVEALVGTSMLAIESIWSSSTSQTSEKSSSSSTKVLPLKWFIKETLRRSRSNITTLQVALYYLHRARSPIRARVLTAEKAKQRFAELSAQRRAESDRHLAEVGIPTPPGSPSEEFTRAASDVLATSRDPVVCGRRMFLAALICASKFLQDRNYSNRAWSRLSGLPVTEVNANERSFLDVLGYELFIKPETFTSWTARLQKLAMDNEARIQKLSRSPTSPSTARGSLKRANTEYLPAPDIADEPMGSLTSPSRMAYMPKSALSRSATQMDMSRRASVATTDMMHTQQYSPLPIPRRASDAHRYSHPVPPRLTERRGSGFPFGTPNAISSFPLSRRPSLARQLSTSSDCRPQAVPSWNSAIDVC